MHKKVEDDKRNADKIQQKLYFNYRVKLDQQRRKGISNIKNELV